MNIPYVLGWILRLGITNGLVLVSAVILLISDCASTPSDCQNYIIFSFDRNYCEAVARNEYKKKANREKEEKRREALLERREKEMEAGRSQPQNTQRRVPQKPLEDQSRWDDMTHGEVLALANEKKIDAMY